MSFQIFTDTSSDLTSEELQKLNVGCLPISLTIGGVSYPDADGRMPNVDEFYELQSQCGGMTGTAGLTAFSIMEAFELVLSAGDDILYIGITPIMSNATWNSMNIAVSELREKYPERRIETPDTHSIAPGLGLLVQKMAKIRDSGADLDAMLEALEYWATHTAHWFTVEDFGQLKKSGRVSNMQAIVAGALNIKPVMRMPYDGKLESVRKVRGSKAVLKEFIKILKDSLLHEEDEIWVSYGGMSQRARACELAEMVREAHPSSDAVLHRIGPIIGAHTGSTVLAVFFFAKRR